MRKKTLLEKNTQIECLVNEKKVETEELTIKKKKAKILGEVLEKKLEEMESTLEELSYQAMELDMKFNREIDIAEKNENNIKNNIKDTNRHLYTFFLL